MLAWLSSLFKSKKAVSIISLERSVSYSRSSGAADGDEIVEMLTTNGSITSPAQYTTVRSNSSSSNNSNVYSAFITGVKQQNVTQVKKTLLTASSEEDRKKLCNQRSVEGWTPLNYAADHHNVELANLLIDNGADIDKDCMRKLITNMATVAHAALSRCLTSCDDGESKTYLCDYKYLRSNNPPSSPAQVSSGEAASKTHQLGDTHALYVMLRYNREQLLMHPLTYSYIEILWKLNHGVLLKSLLKRLLHLVALIFYLSIWSPINHLFVVRKLVADGRTEEEVPTWAPELQVHCNNNATTPLASWNLTTDIRQLSQHEVCSEIMRYQQKGSCKLLPTQWYAYAVLGILLITSLYFLVQSVLDNIKVISTRSVSSDYILTALIYGISVAVTIPWNGWICYYDYALLANWKWQLASFNVLLACVHFALMLRYVPRIGLYVQMLTDVTKTMLRVLPTVFLILGGFALSFHFLFKASIRHAQRSNGADTEGVQANPFYTVHQAFVKTLAMFAGEFTLDENFGESNVLTLFVLAVLLFVGTIALMNLLTGLAVADINTLQDKATLQRVTSRASYMVHEARCGHEIFSAAKVRLKVISPGICTIEPSLNEMYKSMTSDRFIKCVRWIRGKIHSFMSLQDENRKLGRKFTEFFENEKEAADVEKIVERAVKRVQEENRELARKVIELLEKHHKQG